MLSFINDESNTKYNIQNTNNQYEYNILCDSLDDNNIGHEGSRYLAETLCGNSTLTELRYKTLQTSALCDCIDFMIGFIECDNILV